MQKEVSFIGKKGDPQQGDEDKPHQILLDVLGLHSGSVEFYQRYAESLNHVFNLYNFGNDDNQWFEQTWEASFKKLAGKILLRNSKH